MIPDVGNLWQQHLTVHWKVGQVHRAGGLGNRVKSFGYPSVIFLFQNHISYRSALYECHCNPLYCEFISLKVVLRRNNSKRRAELLIGGVIK